MNTHMNTCVINCNGFQIGQFSVPSFRLYRGEMLVIECYGGSHFLPLSQQLSALFSGEIKHDDLVILDTIGNAERINIGGLRQ